MTASGQAKTPVRVLIVEDNVDGADAMAEVLRYMGADSRIARNGFDALDIAARFAPELVLLDIGLPGMDGFEAARRLRLLNGAPFKLVAMTGYGTGEDLRKTKAAGFDAHLVKPVSPGDLQELLTEEAPPGTP